MLLFSCFSWSEATGQCAHILHSECVLGNHTHSACRIQSILIKHTFETEKKTGRETERLIVIFNADRWSVVYVSLYYILLFFFHTHIFALLIDTAHTSTYTHTYSLIINIRQYWQIDKTMTNVFVHVFPFGSLLIFFSLCFFFSYVPPDSFRCRSYVSSCLFLLSSFARIHTVQVVTLNANLHEKQWSNQWQL